MAFKKAMVHKSGQMLILNTLVIGLMGRNMEREHRNGLMGLSIQVIGKTMLYRVMVSIFGVMEGYLKDNGKIISYMAKGYSLGKMVEYTKARMKTMLRADMEFIHGLMARNLKDNG